MTAARWPHVLGLVALALFPACGGLCQDVVDEYETALRDEAARVGAGTAAPSDTELHVGLTISPGLLQRILGSANAALPPIENRVTVAESGRRAVVTLWAQPVLESIQPLEVERQRVRIHVGIEAQVAVRRPGSRTDHFLPGSADIDGHLSLEQDESGDVVLMATFDALSGSGAHMATLALDPEVAEALRTFVEPGIPRLLLEDVQRVALLRFSRLEAGPLNIRLAPGALSLSPDSGNLFLGFVTNLRPERGGGVQAATEVPEDGLRFSLHPGLPEAAVRLAVADGILPRTFDEAAQSDATGTAHVVLTRFRFDENGFELVFRVWDLREGACWTGEMLAAGYADLDDEGAVALRTNRVAPLPLEAVEGAVLVDTSRWAHFDLSQAAMSMAESLIDLPALVLGDGEKLELEPSQLELLATRVDVDLTVRQPTWSGPVTEPPAPLLAIGPPALPDRPAPALPNAASGLRARRTRRSACRPSPSRLR